MRPFLLALLIASGAHAQGEPDVRGATGRAWVAETERAVWSETDRMLDQYEYVFMIDSTEAVPDVLRLARRRAFRAGVEAARVTHILDVLVGLRHRRGDEIPLCPDEAALRRYLHALVAAGEDVVELDPTQFEDAPFSIARHRARLAEAMAPVQVLASRHARRPQDVCPPVSGSEGTSGHTP